MDCFLRSIFYSFILNLFYIAWLTLFTLACYKKNTYHFSLNAGKDSQKTNIFIQFTVYGKFFQRTRSKNGTVIHCQHIKFCKKITQVIEYEKVKCNLWKALNILKHSESHTRNMWFSLLLGQPQLLHICTVYCAKKPKTSVQ